MTHRRSQEIIENHPVELTGWFFTFSLFTFHVFSFSYFTKYFEGPIMTGLPTSCHDGVEGHVLLVEFFIFDK